MLVLPFAGRVKRRPLWLGAAAVVSAAGVLVSALPHLTGRRRPLTAAGEGSAESGRLCRGADVASEVADCGGPSASRDWGSIAVIFLGQVLFGAVNGVFWIFGMTYADDNTTRANSPLQVALSMAGRVTGPALGYLLGAACLRVNSDPWDDPGLGEGDPRWIGAWWAGFVVVGVLLLILGPFMMLFPATLPLEKSDGMSRKGGKPDPGGDWAREFSSVLRRLVSNKPYMLNVLSTVAFAFAISGVGVFMPKYIEFQFHQKASTSGGLGGLSKTLSAFAGIAAAGAFMAKVKVRARSAAAFCASGVLLSAAAFLVASQLQCEGRLHDGGGAAAECTAACACGSAAFAPVCAADGETAFVSPCHAGCTAARTSFVAGLGENRTIYFDCRCVAKGNGSYPWWARAAAAAPTEESHQPPVVASAAAAAASGVARAAEAVGGFCPSRCSAMLYAVLGLLGLASLVTSAARVPNFICFMRSVEVRDKAASMALGFGLISLFALLPAPLVYGALIDSACAVWAERCGKRGNCLVYDADKLRHNFCGLTTAVLLVGFVFDLGVWYYIKDVEIYDAEEGGGGGGEGNAGDRSYEMADTAATVNS